MNAKDWPLTAPPIVEAVVDIECDMPPAPDIDSLQAAGLAALADRYPLVRKRMLNEHQIVAGPVGPASLTSHQGIQAVQFVSQDEKQLIQFRPGGFSFNRLAPYSSFDDYRSEVERCWRLFMVATKPVLVRALRMRYINRIRLPLADGRVELDNYLNVAPKLPDEQRLMFVGFFSQHSVVEPDTGNRANILFAQQGGTAEHLELIFDIEAFKQVDAEPADWATITATLESLRLLKNLIFRDSLTEKCLNLFRS